MESCLCCQDVDRQYLTTWLDYLSSQARPAQLMTKDHQFLQGLEQVSSFEIVVSSKPVRGAGVDLLYDITIPTCPTNGKRSPVPTGP